VWATVHGVVSLLIVMGPDDVFRWRAPATLADLALGSMLRGMLADPTELDGKPGAKPDGKSRRTSKR
jgi:hypothetical protein